MIEGVDYAIDVASDGLRVWITGRDGSCIARFDRRFGIDVHRPAAEQIAGKGECLFCTHAPADAGDWQRFREAVALHFQINVPVDAICFP